MKKTAYLFILLILPLLLSPLVFGMELPHATEKAEKTKTRRPGGLKYDRYGLIDPSPDVVPLDYLPRDKYGFIDWSKALKNGVIAPKDSIREGTEKYEVPFTEDIIIKSKMDFMPDVLFPHKPHNTWLSCKICHPKIFKMKAGGNDISMIAIWKGEYCGRCHDKVAFPFRNCFRCHSVPREPKSFVSPPSHRRPRR